MQNILVTGGAGFIGSNFIHFLQKLDTVFKIINLDALTYAGSLENLNDLPHPENHIFIEGDINDRPLVKELLRTHSIDTIVHFAAETHVDRSITGPDLFIKTNIMGTFALLEEAREYWIEEKSIDKSVARFHHVSTDEVYGTLGSDEPAWTELIAYAPSSPYAASKASSDHLVRAYHHTFGLPVTITNCSNNYGPRQFPEKLIPLMILNALSGKPLPIYGDGLQIRDWLYVEDHCEAIWNVLNNGIIGETYNVGGNNQPTNLEIITTLCDILDEQNAKSQFKPHQQLITYVKDRPGHDRRYAMDITKIGSGIGWEPREWLETGLQKTIAWYLSHPEWIQTIQKQQDYQQWIDKNYFERGDQN